MRRTIVILAALATGLSAGCGGMQRDRSAGVIKPAEQYAATSAPAAGRSRAGEEPVPCPAVMQATTATMPATGPGIAPGRVVEAGAIQVNERFITLCEVLYPIHDKLKALASAAGGERAFRVGALELVRDEARRQVEQTLLLGEAERLLDEPRREAVDKEVESVYRRALAEVAGSPTALAERLASQGTDVETWKRDVRRSYIVQWYVQEKLNPNAVVTRRMMWDYYRGHRDEFRKPDRVQMQIIAAPVAAFLPTDGSAGEADAAKAKAEARKAIEQAAAELAEGKAFDDVAKRLGRGPMASSGGVWPIMGRGSFRIEEVEEAAFAQEGDAVSKPIETAEGFYIVKTIAREKGRDVSFEDAQDTIAATLRKEQYRRSTMDYLQKLRGRTTVVAAEDFEDVAVQAAVNLFYRP